MYCMKCGREMEEEHVFCRQCLEGMEKYPVKPGTAVLLPKRRDTSFMKRTAPRRKTLTPEEVIRKLRRALRVSFVVWVVTFLLLCVTSYFAVVHVLEDNHFSLGQNYSVFTTEETTEE